MKREIAKNSGGPKVYHKFTPQIIFSTVKTDEHMHHKHSERIPTLIGPAPIFNIVNGKTH